MHSAELAALGELASMLTDTEAISSPPNRTPPGIGSPPATVRRWSRATWRAMLVIRAIKSFSWAARAATG